MWLQEIDKKMIEIMDKETLEKMCKEMNKEIILTLTHENNSSNQTVSNSQLIL